MNATPLPKPAPAVGPGSPAAYHLEQARVSRFREIVATIPAAFPKRLRAACERQAAVIASLGALSSARAVPFWQKRPVSPKADPARRVARGRLSNPTAVR